jgi:hypothetical protein
MSRLAKDEKLEWDTQDKIGSRKLRRKVVTVSPTDSSRRLDEICLSKIFLTRGFPSFDDNVLGV